MSNVYKIDHARIQRDERKSLGRDRLSLMQKLEGSVAICNAKADIRKAIADLAIAATPAEMLKFVEQSIMPFKERCGNE